MTNKNQVAKIHSALVEQGLTVGEIPEDSFDIWAFVAINVQDDPLRITFKLSDVPKSAEFLKE